MDGIEALQAEFSRLADRYGGLYHAYVFVEHGYKWPDFRAVPPEVVDAAIRFFPLGANEAQAIHAGLQGGTLGGSIYLAHRSADPVEIHHGITSFQGAADIAQRTVELKQLVPRYYVAAAQVAPQLPDGSFVPGDGFTGNRNGEIHWLDHLYATMDPPTHGVGQMKVRALQCNVFRASALALGGEMPTVEMTPAEMASACGCDVRTIHRWIEKKTLPAKKVAGTNSWAVSKDALDRKRRATS